MDPYILIMAGGSGTRFWPRSRRRHPKQLLPLYSNKSLLQETLERAWRLTSDDRVFIGCNNSLKKAIQESHSTLKDSNFIIEPEARNTAPVIALAALQFKERFGNVPFVVLSADHYIHPVSGFKRSIKAALKLAKEGYLVTLGIKPSRPDTGYGYLKRGKAVAKHDGYVLAEFKEKPDLKTAMKYLRSNQYYWNAGIFIWQTDTLIEEMQQHCPSVIEPLMKYFPYSKPGQLKKAFTLSEAESIDYALMEKAEKRAVVEADFTWDDVGSWLALERFGTPDTEGNVLQGNRLNTLSSKDNIVISKKDLVCLLGIEDMVVVEDDDVLFIARKDRLDDIKPMLKKMDQNSSLKRFL